MVLRAADVSEVGGYGLNSCAPQTRLSKTGGERRQKGVGEEEMRRSEMQSRRGGYGWKGREGGERGG